VDTDDQLAELFSHELEGVFQAAELTESQRRTKSREFVTAATTVLDRSIDWLITVELDEGKLPQVVQYDAVAAAGFLAGLIGGVVGAAHWLLLACAVVACLASLKGLRHTVSRAQGILFWTVYEKPRHSASRTQAEARFAALCQAEDGVQPADFGAALQGLLDLGCIKEHEGRLTVDEVVIVL
jgi:hypothetical protein